MIKLRDDYRRDETLQRIRNAVNSGDFELAERLCKSLLSRRRLDPDACHVMAFLYARRKQFSESIKFLRLALISNSVNYSAWLDLASVLYQCDRKVESFEATQKLTLIAPDLLDGYINGSKILLGLGRLPEGAVTLLVRQ